MEENFEKVLNSEENKGNEAVDKLLQEHLHISLAECAQALSNSLAERAEEVLEDMVNIAPYGDYSQLTDDPQLMLKFLKEESVKPENWELQFMDVKKKDDKILEMVFFNKSVDDGYILKGFIFLGLSGKIRHSFCQAHS